MRAQWRGYISMLCYAHLNLALLLHKTVLVTFLLASAVCILKKIIKPDEFLYNFVGITFSGGLSWLCAFLVCSEQ